MSSLKGNAAYDRVVALSQNLNQAEDTVFIEKYFPSGGFVRRYGVVGDASEGLLAVNELRLRVAPATAPQTPVDVATDDGGNVCSLDVASARAAGVLVYVNLGLTVLPGETVIVASKVAAGGTSTGNVFLEFVEEPFAGTSIPSTAVESIGAAA
jgi:hypothetical protein